MNHFIYSFLFVRVRFFFSSDFRFISFCLLFVILLLLILLYLLIRPSATERFILEKKNDGLLGHFSTIPLLEVFFRCQRLITFKL